MDYAMRIGIAILLASIPGFIALKKGRSFLAYFFLSFLITPLITAIITLCLASKNNAEVSSSSDSADSAEKETGLPLDAASTSDETTAP